MLVYLVKTTFLVLISLLMMVGGVNHFIKPDFYLAMMPPFLPAHLFLVNLSGVVEAVLGFAILIPSLRSQSGFLLILTLLAIFPANLYMAWTPQTFAPRFTKRSLYVRLPLQFVLIFLVWWTTMSGESKEKSS